MSFWQKIEAPLRFDPDEGQPGFYPAAFVDGRQLLLPIRPLADGEHALASLIAAALMTLTRAGGGDALS